MTIISCKAPGRVNLMGDHTDYNHGLVLPMPISKCTLAQVEPRPDRLVNVSSSSFPDEAPVTFELGQEVRQNHWIDYVQGVTAVLRESGFIVPGFDVGLSSDIPLGAGLSSSAALTIALLRALRKSFELAITDLDIARIAQRVETNFVGAPIGIMDQMAVSLGKKDHALFIDTANLSYEIISLPKSVEVVVIDSGIAHRHATGGYRMRRQECSAAAGLLGVRYLSELPAERMPAVGLLPSPLNRRVKHVISENRRVKEMVRAFKNVDVGALRAILYQSHASLRDDYEVSVPAIDLLISISMKEDGVIGARMTGGGFGGSVVLLADQGKGQRAAGNIIRKAACEVPILPRIVC